MRNLKLKLTRHRRVQVTLSILLILAAGAEFIDPQAALVAMLVTSLIWVWSE